MHSGSLYCVARMHSRGAAPSLGIWGIGRGLRLRPQGGGQFGEGPRDDIQVTVHCPQLHQDVPNIGFQTGRGGRPGAGLRGGAQDLSALLPARCARARGAGESQRFNYVYILVVSWTPCITGPRAEILRLYGSCPACYLFRHWFHFLRTRIARRTMPTSKDCWEDWARQSLYLLKTVLGHCKRLLSSCCCPVAKSCLIPLRPHGLQHTRLLWPPLSSRVCSNSCSLSR